MEESIEEISSARGLIMKLILLYMKLGIKKQLQYKLNFILLCIVVLPIHLSQLFFSWVVVKRFGSVGGWDFIRIAFLYGLLLVSYSLSQVFFRHFRYLDRLLIDGGLDIYYIRPMSIFKNMVLSNLNVMEFFSQLLPSLFVLIYTCIKIDIQWTIMKTLVLVAAIIGGTIIMTCIFVMIGLTSFFTLKSGRLEDIFFTFKDYLNYPICIYGKKITAFLTYILPIAFVNYYPVLYILDEDDSVITFMTLPVALIILGITYAFWNRLIHRYMSTGS